MFPTTLIYSSHNCSPYIHRDLIVERALRDPHDKRCVYLPMSEGARDGDEYERQEYGWSKFRWFLDQYRQWGLSPMPFYWSTHMRREDTDVLLEMLQNAPVVILGGGNTFTGMDRYRAIGEWWYGDPHLFSRMLHDRQERGLLTVGFSAGADQLSSIFSNIGDVDVSCEGFGLARDVVVTLHHEWGREGKLIWGASAIPHCYWFGLPNDSGLAINTGWLSSGLIWQLIRFVVDTSWDIPEDSWHIKTRRGMKIDHFYRDGRHWAFNEGDAMLRLMSPDGSFRRSWNIVSGRVFDYWEQWPSSYDSIEEILEDFS